RASLLAVGLFFLSSRRRHTRSKRDWSSGVCSSDLTRGRGGPADGRAGPHRPAAQDRLAGSAGAGGPGPGGMSTPERRTGRRRWRSEERRVGKGGGGQGVAARGERRQDGRAMEGTAR